MRVGIVGSGTMAREHLNAWRQTEAEIVGLYSLDKKTSKLLIGDSELQSFDSYEQLLDKVDIVDICLPSDLHKSFTIQAANAGKEVICEKPIALNVDDAKEMISACNKAGVRLFIAQVVRFFPQYRKAYQQVQSGVIGDLGVIRLKRMGYMPSGFKNWYADENRSSGIIMDIMIHDIDYALWLGGKVKRVFAKTVKNKNPQVLADYALVTLKFESGAMAILDGGWAYPSGNFKTSLDIAGSEGVIEWKMDDSKSIKTILQDNNKETAAVAVPQSILAESPYTTQIKHYYNAIVNNTKFDVSPQDAMAAVEVALAAKESLKTAKPVYLGGN